MLFFSFALLSVSNYVIVFSRKRLIQAHLNNKKNKKKNKLRKQIHKQQSIVHGLNGTAGTQLLPAYSFQIVTPQHAGHASEIIIRNDLMEFPSLY